MGNNNTSVSLDNYFENFVESEIAQGRYKNASEVICAGLSLLEDKEKRIMALKREIQKGLDSPRVENFDAEEHLRQLKAKHGLNA